MAQTSCCSGKTVSFAPLVSLPHGKVCPQHRGATGTKLETCPLYPLLLLHLLSSCCFSAQGRAKASLFCLLNKLINSGDGSSQVQSEENWQEGLGDAILQPTCSSNQQCTLLLEAGSSCVTLLHIFCVGITPGFENYAHK